MTLVLIFGYLAFTAAMLFLMISPFLGGRQASARAEHLDEEVRELEQLLARREVLLSSLRELEFEHATGKSSEKDHQAFKRRYEREAVAILRRLDELHGGRGWESKIDDALEARLGKRPRAATGEDAPNPDEPRAEEPPAAAPEAAVQEATAQEPAAEEIACPSCGNALETDDIFCSRCGTRVDSATSVADDQVRTKQGATP